MDKHQVEGPFTNDLIRDVNVAAFGVVGCEDHSLVPSATSFSPLVTVLRKSVAKDQSVNMAFLMHEPTPAPQKLETSPYGTKRTCRSGPTMSASECRTDSPFK